MKKTLITTNLITLLFLGITYFTGCNKSARIKITDTATNTCKPCLDKEPYKQVDGNYLKDLINNYRKNHWTTLNSHFGFPLDVVDSRSVWFDMDAVKSFIADVEAKTDLACEKEGHCAKNLGIRIYFGEYDKNQLASSGHLEYTGLHTLIMVPTIQDASKTGTVEENVDFDPEHMTSCSPDLINSQWQSITALMPEITSMNHGTLIPPPDQVCTGAKFMHYFDGLICP